MIQTLRPTFSTSGAGASRVLPARRRRLPSPRGHALLAARVDDEPGYGAEKERREYQHQNDSRIHHNPLVNVVAGVSPHAPPANSGIPPHRRPSQAAAVTGPRPVSRTPSA